MIKAWNPVHVRRNTIIQIVIATISFIFLVRIWPFCIYSNELHVRQQAQESVWQQDTFTASDKKLQTVHFTDTHIYQISMYLSTITYNDEDTVTFRLYDSGFSCVYEEKYSCSAIDRQGMLIATPDMDVTAGADYYYEILLPEGVEVELPVADNSELALEENGILYIDGIIQTQISLVADFTYTTPFGIGQIVLYDLLVIGISIGIYVVLLLFLDRYEEQLEAGKYYARILATLAAAVFAVVLFVLTVIANIFGSPVGDRVVYGLGLTAAVAWLLCALWIPRGTRKPSILSTEKRISMMWRNYLQTVSFALMFYASCQYVNADREYLHLTNLRWMLIFMGIAFLMIQTHQQLLHVFSYSWLGISVVGSLIYCQGFTEEKELYLARLTAAVVVVWGLVVINALLQCREMLHRNKAFWKKISLPYAGVWVVFCIFMYCYRYEKNWVFAATLPFAVLLVYNLSAAGKSRLMKNFTNGILLSFGMVTLFCLCHRPYHYWMLYRYGGIFHTVACTGLYLAVVMAAAMGKLFGKWKNGRHMLLQGWKELFIISAIAAFVMFTMARTAILAVAVNVALVIILTAVTYRKDWKQIGKECALLLAAVVVSFPLMFAALRMIPAVINDPVRYDVEFQDEHFMVYEGDPIDSDKYMTIGRYFSLLLGRIQTSDSQEAQNGEHDSEAEEALLASRTVSAAMLYGLTEEAGDTDSNMEEAADFSNGRFEIFKAYIEHSSFKGNPGTILELENGESYAHAHNSYIMVMYNFGIPAGILFLVICAWTFIKSLLLFYRGGAKYGIFLVPVSLLTAFGITSITEWTFHPCFPAGYCLLFVIVFLMQDTAFANKNNTDYGKKQSIDGNNQ